MKRYGRVDANHATIREFFRANGCAWEDLKDVGHGVADGLVSFPHRDTHGHLLLYTTPVVLVEVKNGAKARTKPETAKRQAEFRSRFPVFVVKTLQDAETVIEWLK